jgi:hypothetical protein
MNYINSTIPSILPLSAVDLTSLIGQDFQDQGSITYTPTKNTNMSELGLSPNLAATGTKITFETTNSSTFDSIVCQFSINLLSISSPSPIFIPPGIIEMNIYAKATNVNDIDKIGLRFYLLGSTGAIGAAGSYTNLISNGSDIAYIFDTSQQMIHLNMYIQNPIIISDYSALQFIITSRNINSSPRSASVYFQSSNTYSHIHTTFNSSASINILTSGSGSTLINPLSNNPNFYLKSLTGAAGINISSTSTDITLTNTLPSTLINIGSTGSGESLIGSTNNPNFYLKSIVGSSNILVSTSGNNIIIGSTGSWTNLGFEFQPSNMGDGGQSTFGASQAFYKSEWAPCTFTTSSIKYFKISTNLITNIAFALYTVGPTGTLITNTLPQSSTGILGIHTADWITPFTFNKGDRFISAISVSAVGSDLTQPIYGISLSPTLPNITNRTPETTPYFYTSYWTNAVPPATVPWVGTTGGIAGISSAIHWYILL